MRGSAVSRWEVALVDGNRFEVEGECEVCSWVFRRCPPLLRVGAFFAPLDQVRYVRPA